MGYTHYMRRPHTLPAGKFVDAAVDCRAVCTHLGIPLRREYDEPGPAEFGPDEVRFNGVGEDGYETFLVQRVFGADRPGRDGLCFDFCKTNRKPYDAAVCACLIVFAHHFDGFIVSSDGDGTEDGWVAARAACQAAMGYGSDFKLGDE